MRVDRVEGLGMVDLRIDLLERIIGKVGRGTLE